MNELFTYTLTERLSDGMAELIMYAEPCQMPSEDGRLFTIAYWYEHDNQVRYAEDYAHAIAAAKDEFAKYKHLLTPYIVSDSGSEYSSEDF